MIHRQCLHALHCLSFFSVALLLWTGAAQAAGTVGTGTPASCTDAALDTALTGGGLVTFNCGGGAVTITVLTTKSIMLNTTIDGGNLVTLSGGNVRGVMGVNSGAATLTLQNLTIANGAGGVFNAGTLIVTNSTFTANRANVGGAIINASGGAPRTTITGSTFSGNTAADGGAIYNSSAAALTITNSTFTGNSATGSGGALYSFGNVTITGSTFSGNTAAEGGAIFHIGNAVPITNSTFTGNSATGQGGAGQGGALHGVGGLITLRNVTISGNSAVGSGGGFFDGIDNSEAHNSIIANNTPDNCGGTAINSIPSSYNLIGDASCGISGTGNLINTNPLLAALASNGGPTQTMALSAGSPAINTGSPNPFIIDTVSDFCATVDQRGTARPQGPRCDIGAFEVVAAAGPQVCYTAPSATGSGIITACFAGGGATCTYSAPQYIGAPPGAPPIPPTTPGPGIVFPHGMFDFSTTACAAGSTLSFTITYPAALSPGTVYWKYGPRPGPLPTGWYVLPATIAGNTATFTITDGGVGDDDLVANGTIVDQGGPGSGPGGAATSVPTLSEWAIVLLALLLLGITAYRYRSVK